MCVVFKKPYGFLIKHFKLIHLILTGLYLYLAIKVNRILGYYNHFIQGTASKLDAMSYVTQNYIFAIVLSIIICLVVYVLMRYKKKPRLFYLLLIAFYLVVAVMIQISYDGLYTIYISALETKTVRLYRDLLQILILVQYFSVVLVLIRGLGFDIKKFNFVADLQELNIDFSDEEEVELTLGNTNHIQRKVHRGFREFKYYYFENKAFIHIVLVIVVLVAGSFLFVRKEVINKEYQENEVFSSEEFNFRVLNSFITNRGYDNSIITNTDTSFVIVRMGLATRNGKKALNTSNLVLKVNQNSYSSDKKYAARFVDLGSTYRGQTIDGSQTYLFVYSIRNEDINGKMRLVYAEDKTVYLNPVSLDTMDKAVDYKLSDVVDLSKSSMGSGSFQISSYDIKDKFIYSYDYEIRGEVHTGSLTITSVQNVILHLEMTSDFPYGYDNYSFLSGYAKLRYQIGEEEYVSSVFGDKTPGDYKGGLYLVVDKEVMNATKIWLDIKVRNSQYIYTLK